MIQYVWCEYLACVLKKKKKKQLSGKFWCVPLIKNYSTREYIGKKNQGTFREIIKQWDCIFIEMEDLFETWKMEKWISTGSIKCDEDIYLISKKLILQIDLDTFNLVINRELF